MAEENPRDASVRTLIPAAEITPARMVSMATALVQDGFPNAGRYLMVAAQRLQALANVQPVAFLRDLDGSGSFHPCAEGDEGAFPVYAEPIAAPESCLAEVERAASGFLASVIAEDEGQAAFVIALARIVARGADALERMAEESHNFGRGI